MGLQSLMEIPHIAFAWIQGTVSFVKENLGNQIAGVEGGPKGSMSHD